MKQMREKNPISILVSIVVAVIITLLCKHFLG